MAAAEGSASSPHVLLFSDPLGVNAGQLYALARALASAIPEATFSFLGNQETLVCLPQGALNLRLISFDHGIPNVQLSVGFFERFFAQGPQIYNRMLKYAAFVAKRPVTCVISDAFMWITECVTEVKMLLPWIAVYFGFPLAMLAHVQTELLRSIFPYAKGETTFSQHPLSFIPGFGSMRVCDLPNGIVSGDTANSFIFEDITNGYAHHINGMEKILREANIVVVPSLAGFPELDSLRFAELKNAFPIGPLSLLSPPPPCSNREDCLRWLDHHPDLSVVYVHFDSCITSTLASTELIEVARGLEESHVPFLWSIKEEHKSCLPQGFVERTREIGMLVSWVPQLSVLNHPAVAVFLSLSGWKEALESISAGVPMMCRPFNGDGRMVARALQENWGAGVNFDGPINRWWFVRAIKAIMEGYEGLRMRQQALELRDRTLGAMVPNGSLANYFDDLVKFVRGEMEEYGQVKGIFLPGLVNANNLVDDDDAISAVKCLKRRRINIPLTVSPDRCCDAGEVIFGEGSERTIANVFGSSELFQGASPRIMEENDGSIETNTESDDCLFPTLKYVQPPCKSINMLQCCRSVDDFEMLNKINEGTYGIVYRARDKKNGEIVALKKGKMEKEHEGFSLNSLREITILLSLHHPSIVEVKEVIVGSDIDGVFIAMEYLEHDLKRLMKRLNKQFHVSEIKCLMLQLLSGVKHLHDNWVLHRDLKPSNLLFNNRGELKICDFGLSRQYDSPPKPYTPSLVTLWYRAPELLFGAKEYSTAVDMWSLGCIMAELLTKKPLFSGKSSLDQLDKIFSVLGRPNEKIWPGFAGLPCAFLLRLCKQARELPQMSFRSFLGRSLLSDTGFDLLRKLLTYDPEKRITADEALHHPWFLESAPPT